MKRIIIYLLASALPLFSGAQDKPILYCGQPEAWEKLMRRNPSAHDEIERATRELEEWTQAYEANRSGGEQEIYIIPVVFHVIHNNGPENISNDQILNALEILNRDFRMQNTDISLVVDAFQDITADVGIEFRLATKDPQGNCSSGINRIVSELTFQGDDEMKDLIYWPRNQYMNVWICADAAGAAGYTNLPANVAFSWLAPQDGIVIRSDYVGAIGTSNSTRSRALTHEVGHWLNLLHTWGSGNSPGISSNCNMDDNVSDTPNTIGWTSCNLSASSCNSTVDNVQNYMEYSYCSRMFTEGQATRMRAALTSTVAQRNQLITTSTHNATGVLNPPLCTADFTADKTNMCIGETVQFTDLSYHGINQWTWNFGDGTILTGSDPDVHRNPQHTYMTPGSYTVTLSVSNGSGDLEVTSADYVLVLNTNELVTPLQDGFEGDWPGDTWSVINYDNVVQWEVTPAASFSGDKSARLRNFNNTVIDATDELISSTFDMSGADTVYIGYKWSYANRLTETDDRFRIFISANCGESWTMLRLRRGSTNLPTADPTNSSFVPSSSSQWGEEVLLVNDPAFMTSSFRVKFELQSKGGNNLYLDDINIWTGDETLVGVSEQDVFNGLVVYPNPAQDELFIDFNLRDAGHVRIELIDLGGRLCLAEERQAQPGEMRFRIPGQTAGMYLLRLSSPAGQTTRRVVFR